MKAFDKVFLILTDNGLKNGHALANIENERTLRIAKRELSPKVIKKDNSNHST